MVQKWHTLSSNKRSAYRWESLDKATKAKLSTMAPVNKIDYLKAKEEKKAKTQNKSIERDSNEQTLIPVVAKLPECACCGMQEGFGLTLLNCSQVLWTRMPAPAPTCS